MRLLSILGFAVGGSLLAVIILFIVKGQASKQGQAPGLVNDRLTACSVKPNCVNSEERTPADKRVAPLTVDGEAGSAWVRLQQAIVAQGGELVTVTDGYLAATYTSALFGFVDDLEARLDGSEGVIHLRSASRVGHSDLGANRTRVEQLRVLYKRP